MACVVVAKYTVYGDISFSSTQESRARKRAVSCSKQTSTQTLEQASPAARRVRNAHKETSKHV